MVVTLMSLSQPAPGDAWELWCFCGRRDMSHGSTWAGSDREHWGGWGTRASEAALRDGAGLAFQVLPEAGVGDGGQAAGALGQGPALQFGRAELGDDHVHLTAGRGDRA